MDGATPATPDNAPAANFTYRFTSPYPGTYWVHPHTGLDTDYGLYLPLIIDDPAAPGDYDAEWIVVLDDWTAGVAPPAPDPRRAAIASDVDARHGGHGWRAKRPARRRRRRRGIPTTWSTAASPPPTTFTAKPGERIRIRIINAAADTAFRVALAGHRMTVTHTDGFPVVPTDVDAVLLGMGERYDVIVTAGRRRLPPRRVGRRQERRRARPAVHRRRRAPDVGLPARGTPGPVGTVGSPHCHNRRPAATRRRPRVAGRAVRRA